MIFSRPTLCLVGLRFALAVFVIVSVLYMLQQGISTSTDILYAVIMGLISAGLILGPAWILLSVLGFILNGWGVLSSSVQKWAEKKKPKPPAREPEPAPPTEDMLRLAQLREQQRREAEIRRDAEAQARTLAAQRRENARLACEVLYNLRAPAIRDRFSHGQLADFFKKYMGEDKSVELVERRAGELQQLIQQHFEAVNPPDKFTTLADLTAWYEEQHKQINSLPASGLYKDHFLVRLNERYSELSERLMERI